MEKHKELTLHDNEDRDKENKHENKRQTHEDEQNEKIICVLAYILFFVPLLAIPNSKKGKFHANQGLNLLIVSVVGNTVLSLLPFIGWAILPLFNLTMFILMVLGVVNAGNGKEEKLPVIGDWFNLLK